MHGTVHSAPTDSGTAMLRKMSRARRFNRWMADTIVPFVGDSVLEIGAGIGNLTELLYSGRSRYVASDTEREHLTELAERFPVETALWDAAVESGLPAGDFDTVVCLNVLEHIADDRAALRNFGWCLRPGGRIIVLVPQGAAVYGSFDEILEHKRRYSRAELAAKVKEAGFRLERILPFNRVTYLGWFLNARLLQRRTLSTRQLSVFESLVPVWRRIDRFLPWPPASLIAIATKPDDAA